MTLKEAQERVDGWINTYGVRYFSELTNMAQLTEEAGEVARIVSRKYGDQSHRKGETPGELADELADVRAVAGEALAHVDRIEIFDTRIDVSYVQKTDAVEDA